MRRRLLLIFIGVGILGVGGYAVYNYSLNVIADKISNQLVVEAENNKQLLEQIDLPAIPQTTGDVSPNDKTAATKPNTTDKQSQNAIAAGSKPIQEEAKPTKVQDSAASDQGNSNSSTEKKSKDISPLSFSSKQEAVKFVMSRFSAAELSKLRQMASGGLTPEKKAELKKIAYSKFTSSEIEAVQKVVTTQ